MHDPFSEETDRRVWAMVGKVCHGCVQSCGNLERCPMLRARWFGDTPTESNTNREPRQLATEPKGQLALF
jgi:hypothetical protein